MTRPPQPVYAATVREIGARSRKLPAPQAVVWDSLMVPAEPTARPWLNLLEDEVAPRVVFARKPDEITWSSLWPSRPNDTVHLTLSTVGSETLLKFTLLTPGELPDSSKTGHLRRRLNYLLFADLRFSYGQ